MDTRLNVILCKQPRRLVWIEWTPYISHMECPDSKMVLILESSGVNVIKYHVTMLK